MKNKIKDEIDEIGEIKSIICAIIICLFIVSFIMGIMLVKLERGCRYTTILSRINLGYVIGCELARPRFNLEDK